jgi:hypothetical protein
MTLPQGQRQARLAKTLGGLCFSYNLKPGHYPQEAGIDPALLATFISKDTVAS